MVSDLRFTDLQKAVKSSYDDYYIEATSGNFVFNHVENMFDQK